MRTKGTRAWAWLAALPLLGCASPLPRGGPEVSYAYDEEEGALRRTARLGESPRCRILHSGHPSGGATTAFIFAAVTGKIDVREEAS